MDRPLSSAATRRRFCWTFQLATIAGVPVSAVFALIVFLIVAFVLYATSFGRRLFMVGGDRVRQPWWAFASTL